MPAPRSEPPARFENDPRDIVAYLADFHLTLAELAPEQVAMFLAARGVAHYVEELETPIARQPSPSSEAALIEHETEETLDHTRYRDESYQTRLPTDDMDLDMIRSIEDLPRIFPTQWILEELNPDLFYARLAQQELLMPVWKQSDATPEEAAEDARQRDLVEEHAAALASRQHAYVLLDTSRTMNDHDRRGTVARGLALAFLRKGYRQRARLHFRPFTATVGELSSAMGQAEFTAMARRIIGLPNAGQTRIQTALEQAVRDIRQEGPCLRAGIMLISDGISRLAKNPLEEEKLFTFILGDLVEDQGAIGTLNTLKEWSTRFRRILKPRFAEILAPRLADVQAASGLLEAMSAVLRQNPEATPPPGFAQLVENVKFLLNQWKRAQQKGEPLPPGAERLDGQLHDAAELLERAGPSPETAPPQGTAPRRSLLGRNPGGDGSRNPAALAALWHFFRQLLTGALQWFRTTIGRILGR